MKNGDDHVIPLNAAAHGVIERQAGKHAEHVFVYRGQPVKAASNSAWASRRYLTISSAVVDGRASRRVAVA